MYGCNDRRIECAGMGCGAALEIGIRSARQRWIVALDADGTYPASAVPRLRREVEERYAHREGRVRRRPRQLERPEI
jgi:hypothetical protein